MNTSSNTTEAQQNWPVKSFKKLNTQMTQQANSRKRALEAINGKLESIKSRKEINEHRFRGLKDERTEKYL